VDFYAHYTDDFLPFTTEPVPGGVRFDKTSTLGIHYNVNFLTPYWFPEGGFHFEAAYEGGLAQLPNTVGVQLFNAALTVVKSPPNLSEYAGNSPFLKHALDWFADTRFVFRASGATSAPSKGEFFSMGGSSMFRGFDLAQREGSSLWVGTLEWRVPIVQRMDTDVCDHVIGLRNLYLAMFYDVGDTYVNEKQVGPVAHAVGLGLRLDVAWFSFIERTTMSLDVAQAVNTGTGVQIWFNFIQPF
jgi:outer membrane protein assembly factor BamA